VVPITPRLRTFIRAALVGVAFGVTLIAITAPPTRASTHPRLALAKVKTLALRAGRPFLDQASPSHGLPYNVYSVRFEPRGDTFIWIVRLHAHYFRFPCPSTQPSVCPPVPAEYAAVHIRDSTGYAYSIKPIRNPST
jgi:hypothetical protein